MIESLSRHPPKLVLVCPCGWIVIECESFNPETWRDPQRARYLWGAYSDEERRRRGGSQRWVCGECGKPPLTDEQIGAMQTLYHLHSGVDGVSDQESRAAVMAYLESIYLAQGADYTHDLYFSYEKAEHSNKGTGWYVCFYPMPLSVKPSSGFHPTDPFLALAELLACPYRPHRR